MTHLVVNRLAKEEESLEFLATHWRAMHPDWTIEIEPSVQFFLADAAREYSVRYWHQPNVQSSDEFLVELLQAYAIVASKGAVS